MEKIIKRKSILLLVAGLFTLAISLTLSQFLEFPDVAIGSFYGMGIGLLLTALFFGNTI